ncbi:MAG: peptidase M3 [Bdellovibrionales bacterium CG10_big_fil_rev_8_21_14_0_10_45_34]|nr:MAG: peptidase M3 [Bdellovibrionales bacterium CG10_big_fil_rev_8_21_14_0_10_45_34]
MFNLKVQGQRVSHLPFEELKTQGYLECIESAIRIAKEKLDKIKSLPAGFDNTILGLDECSDDLRIASNLYHAIFAAHGNERIRALAAPISQKITEFSNDLLLDEALFGKVEAVYQNKTQLSLGTEHTTLLEKTYRDFVRNGAQLNIEQKSQLRKIDDELSKCAPEFSNRVLKATNSFELHITLEKDLEGIPQDAIAEAKAKAADRGGWIFTLQAPSLTPFLTYCKNRELRKQMWLQYNSRCLVGEETTVELVKEIVKLRHQRAHLLGFKSHAEYVLEERMAKSAHQVNNFLQELKQAYLPAAKREMDELNTFAKNELGFKDDVAPWDVSFLIEKKKEKDFHFSEEELRPYFELRQTQKGLMDLTEKLFKVRFQKTSFALYHDLIESYEVLEASGEHLGFIHLDLFARDTKQGGAWMTAWVDQGKFDQKIVRPHIAIVCNFRQPSEEHKTLLNFIEARTLFHEFGHALHGLFSKCTTNSLSGTNVYWDFVELPSQFMENWLLEQDVVNKFATHYKTGETLPPQLLKKLRDSQHFMAGYYGVRQLSFGTLDMAWHSKSLNELEGSVLGSQDFQPFEKESLQDLLLMPQVPGTSMSAAFSHIFAGGYSAGYYSYKWAEVMDADAFEAFKEKGLFDPAVAQSFKSEILERGGSEHPETLYKRFRGRLPTPDALLRRDGIASFEEQKSES